LTLLVGHQEEHLTRKKLNNELLAWLSRGQCRWFEYGPADATVTPLSLASLKSGIVLPFWGQLTQVF